MLNISDFELETHAQCRMDFLEIRQVFFLHKYLMRYYELIIGGLQKWWRANISTDWHFLWGKYPP